MTASTGVRAYLGARRPSWLDETRLRRLTILLVVAAVITSAVLVG